MIGDAGSTILKQAKDWEKYTDLSASTDRLPNGGQTYHIQGGKSLNDIFSDTRSSLCLSLNSDMLRRCLKEQTEDIQSETFLLESEHNEAKNLSPERNQGDVVLKLWLGRSTQGKRFGSCFEDGCLCISSTDCYIFP